MRHNLIFATLVVYPCQRHRTSRSQTRGTSHIPLSSSVILILLRIQNVLLTSDNPPIVKVADFGLAKVVDSLTFLKVVTLFLVTSAL